jgi:ribosome biogenesis ATPase
MRLSGDFDFRALAKATPGYVGADLGALTGAAGVIAVKRIFKHLAEAVAPTSTLEPVPIDESPAEDESAIVIDTPLTPTSDMHHQSSAQMTNPSRDDSNTLSTGTISSFLERHPSPLSPEELAPLTITYADFLAALLVVQPSSKREGFTTIPDVTWRDVGALYDIREELQMAIVQPIRRPEIFRKVGITAACGVLMWGPPGCGKTLLAKAVAKESRANFISVKGPELLNKVRPVPLWLWDCVLMFRLSGL